MVAGGNPGALKYLLGSGWPREWRLRVVEDKIIERGVKKLRNQGIGSIIYVKIAIMGM